MDLDMAKMEEKWRVFWEEHSTYAFNPDARGKIYSIDSPPPTVSGDLHMGHSFSYVHQDIIARFKRMSGFKVFYPMGFDDNGLPTEKYSEKLSGKRLRDFQPEEFIDLCNKAGLEGGAKIKEMFRKLGLSADLGNAYRTYSEESRRISQSMFLDLVRKKRVYRNKGPVLICPSCRTAISQIDMKDMERETDFYYIRFKGVDTKDIQIATTRPEMLGSCVAVFVNPDDARYSEYIGKKVSVPLYEFSVKIYSDQFVDPGKGTGAEMVCTFGDQNDVDLWRKYSLDTRMIIDSNGRMKGDTFVRAGITTTEARKIIVEHLKSNGFVTKSERKKQTVNVHERCDTPVEIGILDQWYIKYLDLRDKMDAAGNSIKWYPDFMKVRYDNWVRGLKVDWCISRQRVFGVTFPLWYCKNCGEIVYADESMLPVDPRFTKYNGTCPKCSGTEFVGETDVMDTWATSSLSPRLASQPRGLFEKIYPMTARFQGHEIITSWAFTSIVRAMIHDNEIPWNQIVLSGIVKNPQGLKMSKSRGDKFSPDDFVQKYGSDAVRHWSTVSGNGEDISIDEKDFMRGRKTVVKMLNAGNLVSTLGKDHASRVKSVKGEPENWILKELSEVTSSITEFMNSYSLSKARMALDNFFWNTFCDNYLEISKARMKIEDLDPAERVEIASTLYLAFESILKLYAPIMPFITEELYHTVLNKEGSIHNESWPVSYPAASEEMHRNLEYVIRTISMIRSEASKAGKVSGSSIILHGERELLEKHKRLIEGVTRAEIVSIDESPDLMVQVRK
ncbi:MAG: valine--tRNA ligase [Candidatus Thermoplasmatota archaeon]|nr:valine--tRNA ligase [Candidatus Thermoplasmatota archaeon]